MYSHNDECGSRDSSGSISGNRGSEGYNIYRNLSKNSIICD